MVVPTVFLVDPAGERRGFVVEEDAAVCDSGFADDPTAGFDVERIFVGGGDIGPPVPGRDADVFREIVDAVDGSTLVAAGDDEGARDAWEGMIDDLSEGRFPFAANGADIDFVLADEAIDEGAFADGSNDDEVIARRRCGFDEGRGQASYAL